MLPGWVFGAPASGQGKTTVVCGIAAALQARGHTPRCFKAGPDYLDPSWHRVVTGQPSLALDAWMTGEAGVWESARRGLAGGSVALVEGMMGLFDGPSAASNAGSAAGLAVQLGLPVVVVVDAGAMARTAAAVVHGLARFAPEVPVVGVIFNRVGSPGHTALLAEAMRDVPGVAVLGGLPSVPALAIPERHLGLVAAPEGARAAWREALAAWVAAHLDLDALLSLARPLRVEPPSLPGAAPARPIVRIGVALDDAFHFYYAENLERLREAGAVVVPFSPLHDPALPPALDGLYLGGGYPELYARALSDNAAMRADILAFARSGRPVYAECGGWMYLGQDLDGVEMCGALPTRTRLTDRLQALGYREITTTTDTLLGPAGTVFRGHEFRHSTLVEPPPLSSVYQGRAEGWARGRVLGSYVHAHFGSNPSLAPAFVQACRDAQTEVAWRGR